MPLLKTVSKLSTKSRSAGVVLGSVVGGVAGFFSADFIGLGGIIDSIWTQTGMNGMIPALSKLQPMIVGFIAGGIYLGLGLAIMKIDGEGWMKIITSGGGWFGIGAGAREIFIALTSGFTALKTVTG